MPTILIISSGSWDAAEELTKRYGANDFLLKGEINAKLLRRVVYYVYQKYKAERTMDELKREFNSKVQVRTVEFERTMEALYAEINERKRIGEELRHHQLFLEEIIKDRTYELIAAKEKAEAANYAKNKFLARISHEIAGLSN